jgi:hypothetical protein
MTPEEKEWQQIGAQLTASGGSVQTKDEIHLSASRDVAAWELAFTTGEPDYTHFVDGTTLGAAEATVSGFTYIGFEEQPRNPFVEKERRLSVVEELESVVSANLQRATCLRQSILQKAFTGELTC